MISGKLYNSGNKKVYMHCVLLLVRFVMLFVVSGFLVQRVNAVENVRAAENLGRLVEGGKAVLSNDYFKAGMRATSTVITVYGVLRFLANNMKYLKTDVHTFYKNLSAYLVNYVYRIVGVQLIMIAARAIVNHLKNNNKISEKVSKKLLKNIDKVNDVVKGGGNFMSLRNIVDTVKFIKTEVVVSLQGNNKESNLSKLDVLDKWVDVVSNKKQKIVPQKEKDNDLNDKKENGIKQDLKELYDELVGDEGPVNISLVAMNEEAEKNKVVAENAQRLKDNVEKVLNVDGVGKNFVFKALNKVDVFKKIKEKFGKVNPKKMLDDMLYTYTDKLEKVVLKHLSGEDVIKFKEEIQEADKKNANHIEKNKIEKDVIADLNNSVLEAIKK